MTLVFQFLAVGLWVISNGQILQNGGFDLNPNSFDVMLNYKSLDGSEYLLTQSTNKYIILHNITFLRNNYVDSPDSANLWYHIDAASKGFVSNGTIFCKLCEVGKNINYPQTDYELETEISTKTLETYIRNSTVFKTPAFQTLNFNNPFQEMTKTLNFHSLHCAYTVPYCILPAFYPIFKFPKFIFENISKIFSEKYTTTMTMDPYLHNSSPTIQKINISNYDNSLETNELAEERSPFSSEDTARVNENALKPFITDNSLPYAQTISSTLLPIFITKTVPLPAIQEFETSSYSQYPSFTSDHYGASDKFSESISPSISYLASSNEVTSETATPTLDFSDNFDISSSSTYRSSVETTYIDTSSGEVRCADSRSSEASYIDSSSNEASCIDSSSREVSYEDNSSSREVSYEDSNNDETRYGYRKDGNVENYGLYESSTPSSSSSCFEDSIQAFDSALIQSSSPIYFSSTAF